MLKNRGLFVTECKKVLSVVSIFLSFDLLGLEGR